MRLVSRREILKVATGFIAFLPAARNLLSLGNLPPEPGKYPNLQTEPPPDFIPHGQPPAVTSIRIDKFAEGSVLEVAAYRIAIQTPDRGNIVLHLSPKTWVWEDRFVKDIPTEAGDTIYAWGERREDGSYDVEKIWVNLVNLIGPVLDVKQVPDGLQLRHQDRHQGAFVVKLEQRTLVALKDEPKATLNSKPLLLYAGQFVQVIGRKLKDGSVLATDVYTD